MQINQIMPSIDYGDAVSNDAISISKMLREKGYESTIYAKYIHPKMVNVVKELAHYKGNPNNIIIYHFSLAGDDVTEFVKKLPDKKILMYHNITPPEFLLKYDNNLAMKCEKGLQEIKSLPAYFNIAIARSEFSKHELEKIGFKNTYVLPVLIDFNKLKNNQIKVTNKDNIIKLLFVGRISPNKKQEDIIKIFYYYYNFINKNSQLYLVGKEQISSYEKELKELINKLNLSNSVVFTGQVDDESLVKYYQQSDIFICMSEHEGFCVPLVEAMYFNIPIIAYNSTAVPDTLRDAGIIVNIKNYKEIAEMINIIISDISLRNKIIKKQSERLKDFESDKVVHQLIKIIEKASYDNFNSCHIIYNNLHNPMVSIIICTYNRGAYLKRCLDSLNYLDYQNYEIIVVNGPSTDNTDTILSEYKNIKVIKQEKLNGLSHARNLGIKASSGDIIAFIDDDAVADRYWLTSLVNGYKDNTIGGVGGYVFDITGQWYQFKNGYISKYGIPTFNNDYDKNYNDPKGPYYNYIMGTNSSFRRDVLLDIGLFDENIRYYLDETDVCVRVIKKGYKIIHNPNAKICHEMAEGHNRKSQYDVDYQEIMKNVIYFTIKNFGDEISSYTIRPCQSIAKWVKDDFIFLNNKKVTVKQFIYIFIKLLKGAISGYVAGLKYRLNGM